MARILLTERLAPQGIELMSGAGHVVDERLGLSPAELIEAVDGYEALVIRSATKVTEEVLRAGSKLVVVGRAGIGLDNVDVRAATSLGVMVVNAPESNIVSAAEHTFALLLAAARNIPQAHSALVEGRWERSRFEGVELHSKVLGIVGLGRIGTLVAGRALAFGMRVVAYDPYVSAEKAKQMGVDLTALDNLVSMADFITVHLPKTPETQNLFGKEMLARVKPGARIVNTSRGGIVDEEALTDAISSGRVAGAALDVFANEPCTSSPLFGLAGVVVTPHLGASTREAQGKAGVQIAEQVVLALAGEFVPYAVNVSAGQASEAIRPYLNLAENLGRLLTSLCEGLPSGLEVVYEGELAREDTRILTIAVEKGVFSTVTEQTVSFVNAPSLARERGIAVKESSTSTTRDYVSLVTVRSGRHAAAATLVGAAAAQRIVMVDDHRVELPFASHLLVVRNDDRPGMVGVVGSALGGAGVSIQSMAVGQTEGDAGTALMLLSTDVAVPSEVAEALRREPGIFEVHQVSGPWSEAHLTSR